MASPQLENGFTKISNEILETLVNAGLLGSEFQVILFVIRKTYGWGKKRDIISLTQFEQGTNLSRLTIIKTIKNLVIKNMLVKTAIPHNRITYSYQKNYNEWVVNTDKLVKHSIGSKDRLTRLVNTAIPKVVNTAIHTKEKKETIQKGSLNKIRKHLEETIRLKPKEYGKRT